MPFVRPLVGFAATADSPGEIQGLVDEAIGVAMSPPTGPAFLDFPLDHVFSPALDSELRGAGERVVAPGPEPIPAEIERAGRAPARRRAARDHGRDRALLGARRVGVALAGRGPADPGVSQRPGARMPARRPRAVLLQGPQHRARGRAPTWRWLSASRSTSGSASAPTFADDAELIMMNVAEPERRAPAGRQRRACRRYRRRSGRLSPPLMAATSVERQRWVESLSEIEASARAQEGGGARRRALAAAPDAGLRRASGGCSTATRS